MKKLFLICISASLLLCPASMAEKRIKTENLKQPQTSGIQTKERNVSATSNISYEDAMTRIGKTTPSGYALASVRYARINGAYVIFARFIKVG